MSDQNWSEVMSLHPTAAAYKPKTNAVIIHLHETQDADGSLNLWLSYSVEVKDQHLEGDLRRLAQELMDKRGFKA